MNRVEKGKFNLDIWAENSDFQFVSRVGIELGVWKNLGNGIWFNIDHLIRMRILESFKENEKVQA